MPRGGIVLVALAMAAAVSDWVAVGAGARRAEYVLKPLTLGLLIAAAAVSGGEASTVRWAFTLAALVLSLAGDVFLVLPGDRFVPGLASFLLAHVAYMGAFTTSPPPLPATAVAFVLVGTASLVVFRRIRRGIIDAGRHRYLVPVAAYVAAISAMVISAAATLGRPDWGAGAAALAVLGAGLFYASDGLIGWARFVGPVPGGRVGIMATYHLGQVLLVLALLG